MSSVIVELKVNLIGGAKRVLVFRHLRQLIRTQTPRNRPRTLILPGVNTKINTPLLSPVQARRLFSRRGTPLCGLYRYLRPQRLWFFIELSGSEIEFRF